MAVAVNDTLETQLKSGRKTKQVVTSVLILYLMNFLVIITRGNIR
jgi:hypothetical protein